MAYYGGEISHHKDCKYYPESRTEMYDKLKQSNTDLQKKLDVAASTIKDMVRMSKEPCQKEGCTCVANIGQIYLATISANTAKVEA